MTTLTGICDRYRAQEKARAAQNKCCVCYERDATQEHDDYRYEQGRFVETVAYFCDQCAEDLQEHELSRQSEYYA